MILSRARILSDMFRVRLMGLTGSGKTTFVNLARGAQGSSTNSLEPETDQVHQTEPFWIDGQKVILVDTPGFDDAEKTEKDILNDIKTYLRQTRKKLTGIIYMHRITDNRMGGTALKNFNLFQDICGPKAMKNVTIVTTMWDVPSARRYGEDREKQLQNRWYKEALAQGAHMERHQNTPESTNKIIQHIIRRSSPVAPVIEKPPGSWCCSGKSATQNLEC
ncbi:hypothetical protein AcW1_005911 [Taiwanofungus camphoratus]|nr:hypothetical protein AcW2_004664 [Antrodia cinnamomea]KAI0934361.1 hypothetical protein AcV5_006227 [Antrodia cinnamomea]KAI0934362.1 hypothetical protein AcV5_006227 [Antrodia cinnamomea]KAI0957557.1 hypothetical protein AcW1_005911 [Antrodia cinnamomea]KAI0957558.1 hypothetical protein AcW1_005911 [Antrodia cinnamomea]